MRTRVRCAALLCALALCGVAEGAPQLFPVYLHGGDEDSSWWCSPIALSWGHGRAFASYREESGSAVLGAMSWSDEINRTNLVVQRSQKRILGCLSRWTRCDGELADCYVAPLFYWNREGTLLTPLWGRLVGENSTNEYYTPLLSFSTGQRNGMRLLPVFSSVKDVPFDEALTIVGGPKLAECVAVSVKTNEEAAVSKQADGEPESPPLTKPVGPVFDFGSDDWFLFNDFSHHVAAVNLDGYHAATNRYLVAERRWRGNEYTCYSDARREVTFDLRTREKLADAESYKFNLLDWVCDYNWKCDRMTGESSVRTSILIRMFHYERDPEKGTSVDLCFLPVWR